MRNDFDYLDVEFIEQDTKPGWMPVMFGRGGLYSVHVGVCKWFGNYEAQYCYRRAASLCRTSENYSKRPKRNKPANVVYESNSMKNLHRRATLNSPFACCSARPARLLPLENQSHWPFGSYPMPKALPLGPCLHVQAPCQPPNGCSTP